MFVVLLALVGMAHAGDVYESLGDGVSINWTTMSLEVSESATGFGTESSTRAVEQMARQKVGPGVLYGARRIRVEDDSLLDRFLDGHALSDSLQSRISRWYVSETRYYASGKVGLIGELSLQDVMKPLVLERAKVRPDPTRQPRYTGLVVDARGTDIKPAYLPKILGSQGTVLFDGSLWQDVVLERTPVVYVADPSDSVAARAGGAPMFIQASSGEAGAIVLDKDETLRFETALRGAEILGEGRIVVVVGSGD